MPNPSFEQTLIEVWRQALVENAKVVVLGAERFPVRLTPKHRLRQVDFVFDGNEIRGLEQNPETKSRWAQMARAGKKVMQFLGGSRYVANVVDGKVTPYGGQVENRNPVSRSPVVDRITLFPRSLAVVGFP
jgi:hypothetical protein